MRKEFIYSSFWLILTILSLSYFHSYYWLVPLVLVSPIILLGTFDLFDKKHTIIANYPIFGRFRYVMEELRPKIYQYFIESDTDGTPINRVDRNVVYQRAKKVLDTTPFGTQVDVYQPGYEWINHSLNPLALNSINPTELRIDIGGDECKKIYSASILNISAMSYGSLSSNAIESLNWGAKIGGFAHNTGEGSISPYHQKHGGDLIWQIGTSYFGCRTENGQFCEKSFQEKSQSNQVKMIEIKISQGAKPGHGGILPAAKNTQQIAKIRQVKAGTSVNSPGKHTAFDGNKGLLQFIKKLRDLSGGKPVGIKLCMGNPYEFDELCVEMKEHNIFPDFITIDGGEGGTGAAPPEFSNSIGMSLRDGLIFAHDILLKNDIRSKLKILASGKIITGFDIVKILALGADGCYAARSMMLALGCIQALVCNQNKCPTGIATQKEHLIKGLNVEDKYIRVANYHHGTLESVAEIMCASGLTNLSEIKRHLIWRRISFNEIKNYNELFPCPEKKIIIETKKPA
jgi:glutamate synthase domain-containing protein 2